MSVLVLRNVVLNKLLLLLLVHQLSEQCTMCIHIHLLVIQMPPGNHLLDQLSDFTSSFWPHEILHLFMLYPFYSFTHFCLHCSRLWWWLLLLLLCPLYFKYSCARFPFCHFVHKFIVTTCFALFISTFFLLLLSFSQNDGKNCAAQRLDCDSECYFCFH